MSSAVTGSPRRTDCCLAPSLTPLWPGRPQGNAHGTFFGWKDPRGSLNARRADNSLMRVVLVTESFPPDVNGVAHCALETARHLVRRGHEPLVIAPLGGGAP